MVVIFKFIDLMLRGLLFLVYGDGTVTCDFCYVVNVVEVMLKFCTVLVVFGRVYNIGCGDWISLFDLVAVINDVFGMRIEFVLFESRLGDILYSVVDISVACCDLGYIAFVSF